MTNENALELAQSKVIGWMLDGVRDPEIARRIGVSRQAVYKFRQRHAGKLRIREERIQEAALRRKEQRILDYQRDYDLLGNVIEARQGDERYDEPGYSTGLMTHSLKMLGAGKSAAIVDEFRVDTSLIRERNQIRHAVAEELGELPRATIEVSDRRTYILQVVTSGSGNIPIG